MLSPELRKFPPLPDNHSLIKNDHSCIACRMPFKPGEIVTLVPIGPGKDEEARKKCRNGEPYNAVAIPIHWSCATGLEEDGVGNGGQSRLVALP